MSNAITIIFLVFMGICALVEVFCIKVRDRGTLYPIFYVAFMIYIIAKGILS
jgi:hypothetical protein